MKLLFGFLLLLSIVLFLLMQWGGVLTGAAKNGQMLAELNPEKIILLDKPASAVPAAQSAVAASATAAVSTPVMLAPIVAGASASFAASAPLPASVPATVPGPAKAASSAPPAASAILPSPAPAKVAVSTHPAVSAPATVRMPAAVAKAAAKTCMEWGEFSGADLTRTTKSLSAMNLGERLVRRTVEYSSGYWVYMPPLKNKAAVNRKVAQLKALGVEDYYVVQEPPKMVNVISLGVFKTREAAKNFLASLQKKGVHSATMGERKRKLKFVVFEIKHIDAEAAARLSKLQKEFPYSELKAVSCNK